MLQQAVGNNDAIFGKVRVADVVEPKSGHGRSARQKAFNKISAKHFDFLLCDKEELSVACAIEMDDGSHNSKRRQDRDKFLKEVFEAAGVPLIQVPAKPAVEVIIVAMKPLKEKTFTEQAVSNRKGITWLDDWRIPNQDNENADRLPGNLLVSDQALGRASKFFNLDLWEYGRLPFILSPKASRKEKEAGLQESGDKEKSGKNLASKLRPEPRKNPHPTVKPLKLMSYLITMGSREGDIVLDPFCGTGTTCIAAIMLNTGLHRN